MAKKRKVRKSHDLAQPLKFKDPDPNSDEYMHDAVDQFHMQKDKIMLDDKEDEAEDDDLIEEDDEEVLGFSSEEDEDKENDGDDSDLSDDEVEDGDEEDEEDIEEGLPSDKAWGRSKKAFYNADVDDSDVDDSDEEATKAIEDEEKEALALQKRLEQKLDIDDFMRFSAVSEKPAEPTPSKEKVTKDLSKMSKNEKIQLLLKDSPELLGLMNELKDKLTEIVEVYHPLLQMIKDGKYTDRGVVYVETKHQLLLNYCTNISFYLALKASKEAVTSHPVVETIMQHKQLLEKLEPLDEQLQPEIAAVLEERTSPKLTGIKEKIDGVEETTKTKTGKPSKERQDGLDPLEYYRQIEKQTKLKKSKSKQAQPDVAEDGTHLEGEENFELDDKRAITYEMEKNKGLTRKRRKELRNPRVKHKVKFRKATIKHKSQVREVVKELSRYGGETTGIKASLTRSIKLKS